MGLSGLDLESVLRKHFVAATARKCIGSNYDIVDRGSSISIGKPNESDNPRSIRRLILLPPNGYTANSPNLMNAHNEVERATVKNLGAIRDNKKGFSRLKDSLLFVGAPNKGVSSLDVPYFAFNLDDNNNPIGDNPDGLITKIYSGGDAPFTVVKPDGYGFYHNLINLTGDWLALELNKTVREQREVDLGPHLLGLEKSTSDLLKTFYHNMLLYGDEIYKRRKDLIDAVAALPPEHTLPALGEMLYARETGRHEACSVFAMILKVGKKHPEHTINFLSNTLNAKTVPYYYAEQLIVKIQNKTKLDHNYDKDSGCMALDVG